MVNFEKTGNELKSALLEYFRDRASESLQEVKETYGVSQHKKRARAINREINKTLKQLKKNAWPDIQKIRLG